MKKIGISTVHRGFNYGSALQAYASKAILQELGYQGVILSLKGSLVKGRDVRIKKVATIAFRLLRQPQNIIKRISVYVDNMSTSYSKQTIELFNRFELEKIQPCYYTWNQLKRLGKSDDFEAFLCGSDQIWNADALYVDPQYYLRFAPKNKRVAFAPSFGRNKIADYNKNVIRKYIMDIPYLSVREESGVSIIKEFANKTSTHLIDPTLMLDGTKWDKYLNLKEAAPDSTRYILAYFLNEPSDYVKKYIKELAQKNKLNVVALPCQREEGDWFDITPNAGPMEFVQYIRNASYVCTDSFHGTAFSINFNVPFYTFNRAYGAATDQSSRIISLLEKLGLVERFIVESDFGEDLNTEIDMTFEIANKLLAMERQKSKDYLVNTFSSIEREKINGDSHAE